MRGRAAALCLALIAGLLHAEPAPSVVDQCLACHLSSDGQIDIVGIRALSALPDEWPFLFEDSYDLDGDGIAGRLRYVSGDPVPMVAKFGKSLAAARFEDFALIAGAAHDIDLSEPGILSKLKAEFEARSPAPAKPFPDLAAQARFEARGCARCHVTETFEFEGQTYMPLSDFLLHDLGDGLRRTAPLWGCADCVEVAPHPLPR